MKTPKQEHVFDWADLAFASKAPVNDLRATLIAAPRELSLKRFTELVKTYLPAGNLVLGLAKEPFVDGFDNQPQFRTLRAAAIQKIIDKVNRSGGKYRIYSLHYFQRELKYILEKLDFERVALINGSWKYAFHTLEPYYVLAKRQIDYKLLSPFCDEAEAQAYAVAAGKEIAAGQHFKDGKYSVESVMRLVGDVAAMSFDYNNQTGVVLAKETRATRPAYELLSYAYNKIVPYETYAMHFGAAREKHFSPPNDLNHYDTVHAEVEMLIKAQFEGFNLNGTTLFINVLPCPPCARMICDTGVQQVIYQLDHSDGYAAKLLQKAGKVVKRLV